MGIDYVGAAFDIATEQAASFKIVQVHKVVCYVIGMVNCPVSCRLD